MTESDEGSRRLLKDDVADWIANRCEGSEAADFNGPEYRQHLLATFQTIRRRFLTDADMLAPSRGTAWALLLSSHLYVEGLPRQIPGVQILDAMYSTLPEYPYYYSREKLSAETIPLKRVAKMCLLEAEMFSVIAAHLSGNLESFSELNASAEEAARRFWTSPSTDSLKEVSEPNLGAQGELSEKKASLAYIVYWSLVLGGAVTWFWHSSYHSLDSDAAEAIGFNIVSAGLPLALGVFAFTKLAKSFLARRIARYKQAAFATVCLFAAIQSLFDLLSENTTHKLGAAILLLGFIILSIGLGVSSRKKSLGVAS